VSLAVAALDDTRRTSSASLSERALGSEVYKNANAVEVCPQLLTSMLLHSKDPDSSFTKTFPFLIRQFKWKTMSVVAGKNDNFQASPNGGV
jgi:hypothetical protein